MPMLGMGYGLNRNRARTGADYSRFGIQFQNVDGPVQQYGQGQGVFGAVDRRPAYVSPQSTQAGMFSGIRRPATGGMTGRSIVRTPGTNIAPGQPPGVAAPPRIGSRLGAGGPATQVAPAAPSQTQQMLDEQDAYWRQQGVDVNSLPRGPISPYSEPPGAGFHAGNARFGYQENWRARYPVEGEEEAISQYRDQQRVAGSGPYDQMGAGRFGAISSTFNLPGPQANVYGATRNPTGSRFIVDTRSQSEREAAQDPAKMRRRREAAVARQDANREGLRERRQNRAIARFGVQGEPTNNYQYSPNAGRFGGFVRNESSGTTGSFGSAGLASVPNTPIAQRDAELDAASEPFTQVTGQDLRGVTTDELISSFVGNADNWSTEDQMAFASGIKARMARDPEFRAEMESFLNEEYLGSPTARYRPRDLAETYRVNQLRALFGRPPLKVRQFGNDDDFPSDDF